MEVFKTFIFLIWMIIIKVILLIPKIISSILRIVTHTIMFTIDQIEHEALMKNNINNGRKKGANPKPRRTEQKS